MLILKIKHLDFTAISVVVVEMKFFSIFSQRKEDSKKHKCEGLLLRFNLNITQFTYKLKRHFIILLKIMQAYTGNYKFIERRQCYKMLKLPILDKTNLHLLCHSFLKAILSSLVLEMAFRCLKRHKL